MAKDFANRRAPSRSSKRGGGASRKKKRPAKKTLFHGPSFSGGMLLGAAVVIAGAYAPELLELAADKRTPPVASTPKPKVDFQFDQRLRSQEVQADPSAYASTQADSDVPMEYLIQAASFQKQADADALRAEILLSGLPAKTNPVTVGERPWYRVTVGPFTNNVESGRAMTKLRELNLDAFLIKREVRQQ